MMLRHARTVGLTAAAAGLAAFVWAGPALAAFGDPDLIWGPSGVATADIAGVSSEGATALSGDTAAARTRSDPGETTADVLRRPRCGRTTGGP